MPPEQATLRAATAADGPAIAALHAASWRTAYRGLLGDAYLDGPVVDERARFWRTRLAEADPRVLTLVLEGSDGVMCGFVSAVVGAHRRWGTLVHNLHVAPALKRSGLGRRLLRGLAEALAARRVDGPVFLSVLAGNAAARAFYAAIGGCEVESRFGVEPDGGRHAIERVVWPSLAALRAGLA